MAIAQDGFKQLVCEEPVEDDGDVELNIDYEEIQNSSTPRVKQLLCGGFVMTALLGEFAVAKLTNFQVTTQHGMADLTQKMEESTAKLALTAEDEPEMGLDDRMLSRRRKKATGSAASSAAAKPSASAGASLGTGGGNGAAAEAEAEAQKAAEAEAEVAKAVCCKVGMVKCCRAPT